MQTGTGGCDGYSPLAMLHLGSRRHLRRQKGHSGVPCKGQIKPERPIGEERQHGSDNAPEQPFFMQNMRSKSTQRCSGRIFDWNTCCFLKGHSGVPCKGSIKPERPIGEERQHGSDNAPEQPLFLQHICRSLPKCGLQNKHREKPALAMEREARRKFA